mmetsp:Transcript_29046/g.55752  ORF Transcript_29046/g.55752 Transcript_29046/m.55752 type:complete len:224 (+) Transcript_29046:4186-4857(+)
MLANVLLLVALVAFKEAAVQIGLALGAAVHAASHSVQAVGHDGAAQIFRTLVALHVQEPCLVRKHHRQVDNLPQQHGLHLLEPAHPGARVDRAQVVTHSVRLRVLLQSILFQQTFLQQLGVVEHKHHLGDVLERAAVRQAAVHEILVAPAGILEPALTDGVAARWVLPDGVHKRLLHPVHHVIPTAKGLIGFAVVLLGRIIRKDFGDIERVQDAPLPEQHADV